MDARHLTDPSAEFYLRAARVARNGQTWRALAGVRTFRRRVDTRARVATRPGRGGAVIGRTASSSDTRRRRRDAAAAAARRR